MATRPRRPQAKTPAHAEPATANGFDPSKVHELTREEAWELLDSEARRFLNMGAEEFIRKWDAGEFGDRDDRREVWEVASLLPGVGKNPFA